jgi:hypothetical protein
VLAANVLITSFTGIPRAFTNMLLFQKILMLLIIGNLNYVRNISDSQKQMSGSFNQIPYYSFKKSLTHLFNENHQHFDISQNKKRALDDFLKTPDLMTDPPEWQHCSLELAT